MKSAMIVIAEKLEATGMSRNETNMLLARFLQEEAFDYVDCISDYLHNQDNELVEEPIYKA